MSDWCPTRFCIATSAAVRNRPNMDCYVPSKVLIILRHRCNPNENMNLAIASLQAHNLKVRGSNPLPATNHPAAHDRPLASIRLNAPPDRAAQALGRVQYYVPRNTTRASAAFTP
jgi:hypothetical protein